MELKNKVAWCVAMSVLIGIIPLSAASIGVVQSYMEDGVIKIPQGMEQVCHSIIPATDPQKGPGLVRVEVLSKPDFVYADLNPDNIYTTEHGQGEGITFFINAPQDAEVGSTWEVKFKISGVSDPTSGMVPLSGSIASGFTMVVVPSDEKVRLQECRAIKNPPPRPVVDEEQIDNTPNWGSMVSLPQTKGDNPDWLLLALIGMGVVVGGIAITKHRIRVKARKEQQWTKKDLA
jgi:hypothetical protein